MRSSSLTVIESGLPALGPWNRKFNWELSWEQRSSRLERFIKNSRVYSLITKLISILWSDLPAGGLENLRLRMSITGDESSLSYALPPPAPLHWLLEQLGWILIHWWSHAIFESNFCLWILLSSLLWVIEVSTNVEDLCYSPGRRRLQTNKQKSMMEFLLNNSRAKPSTSNILLDPIKTPINSVCIIIFIAGGTEALPKVLPALYPPTAQNKQLQPLNP